VTKSFPEATNVGPKSFWVLGPFPVSSATETEPSARLSHDYLSALGGEASARFQRNTALAVAGKPLATREAKLDERATLDFVKLFGENTDHQVAYAYAEWTAPRADTELALFGSDDAAAVWLNGREVHRVIANRAIGPDDDRFELPVVAGTNRVLIKVDNGAGGWGFALRALDAEGQRRLEDRQVRENLSELALEPESGRFLLDRALPPIVWSRPAKAARAFGENALRTRWFGPDRAPATSAEAEGQYTALIEATTLDGYAYRRMLTFAKVRASRTRWFRAPPLAEPPSLTLPGEFGKNLSDPARTEMSRHFWYGAGRSLSNGESSAVAALALARIEQAKFNPDEPAWLQSGFIRVAEHQLAQRLTLEGRKPRPLTPPERLAEPVRALRKGSEAQAGIRAGTARALRTVSQNWAKADPNPFVVLIARRGVVFFHEGFNGFHADTTFYPASVGKTIAALTFARAVEQGLVSFDDPVGRVLPDWSHPHTSPVTFRHCFTHVTGLKGHASHGGLFNAQLDNALFTADAVFAQPGRHFRYNGDGYDLAGKALELVTGQSIWRLLHENLQAPFDENVTQLDLGFGDAFSASYLGKVGQMILNDGSYGSHRFFAKGFLEKLRPRPIVEFAPNLDDRALEAGIGFAWMPDPPGPREKGVLGPNVIGHGASSGVTWRVDRDHELVVVVGRNGFKDAATNDLWATNLARTLAAGLL